MQGPNYFYNFFSALSYQLQDTGKKINVLQASNSNFFKHYSFSYIIAYTWNNLTITFKIYTHCPAIKVINKKWMPV